MPDRLLPVSTTPGAITGNAYMDAVQDEVTGLWDRSVIKLTGVTGTNNITATCTPALTGALVDGMKFELVPVAATTSAIVTLDVGTGAKTVVDRDGSAPLAGAIKLGGHYLLSWDATLLKFCVLGFLPPLDFSDRPSFRNILIDNGGLEVWQRGAGGAASIAVAAGSSVGAYTADRWYLITNATQAAVVSQQAGLIARSRFCARVQRTAGQTGTGIMVFAFPLTTSECATLRGSKITFQFLANAGANFSPASGTLTYEVKFGTGTTEGKRAAGFTGESTPITGTVNLALAGTLATVTATSSATVGATVAQGEIRFTWTPVGTAGAADYFQIDNVQLESGDVVTEFEYAPFSRMMSGCQVHYCKTFNYNVAPAQNAGKLGALGVFHYSNSYDSSNSSFYAWRYPVLMRAAATVVQFNPNFANANWRTASGGENTMTINVQTTAGEAGTNFYSNSASGDIYYGHATADASL